MGLSQFQINIDKLIQGEKQAVASALNRLENRKSFTDIASNEIIEAVSENARPDRHVIGITGPPGVGKSALISRMIKIYRTAGNTVGIILVDPSSKKSGGALLGDRIRIEYDPADQGIFIRSMAAGRHLGGLAGSTLLCWMVFCAVYDKIIIETVGVGQSETEIEQISDTVVFILQPGSGDMLQFIKAGIMEIPHILVINKSDQKDQARKTFYDLKNALGYNMPSRERWDLEVIMTSALKGWGIEALILALDRHRAFWETENIREKRLNGYHQLVFKAFIERFGSLGVEVLEGETNVLLLLEKSKIKNPMEGLKMLAEKLSRNLRVKLSA